MTHHRISLRVVNISRFPRTKDSVQDAQVVEAGEMRGQPFYHECVKHHLLSLGFDSLHDYKCVPGAVRYLHGALR